MLFGGEWEQVNKGALYADMMRPVFSYGGQETVMLTADQMPEEVL